MAREITPEERQAAQSMLQKARIAMKAIEGYTQEQVDDLARALAWATANEKTFVQLTEMAVAESKMGNADGAVTRRFKIIGILRDALRQKSIGIIDELPEKGIVKYAKPVGVIAGLLPVTNPVVTMVATAIHAVKCRDAVIFSPHPASKATALEANRILRAALKAAGAPEDLVQCLEKPSIPLAQEIMSVCDLTVATGGPAMVKSAYSSGKPAYGVGAGNATVVVDESANVEEAARNTRISKIHNNGSGCSCDGNLIIDETLYDQMVEQLQKEGGYLCSEEEKAKLKAVLWDEENHRLLDTVARSAKVIAEKAGINIGAAKFIFVEQDKIGKEYPFSGEKLSPVLAVFKYQKGFENALKMVEQIFEVGGKGHSCGIASYNDDNINRLALMAPVSRIMVRQPNVHGNAGSFTNGMPMTASLGCGTWGGNIISENVTTKHFMNTTWVSRTIPEDKPGEQEIFGKFFNSTIF